MEKVGARLLKNDLQRTLARTVAEGVETCVAEADVVPDKDVVAVGDGKAEAVVSHTQQNKRWPNKSWFKSA